MNSTTLQITTQAVGDDTLLGDVLTAVFRPLVPIHHREAVFQSLHSIHHPGVWATCRLIAARFCWPQMAKAITLMARACLYCQQGKLHKHVHLQPAEIPVPHSRFPHIHVDLVGLLPPSRGHTYLFTIIDRTSRWLEAIPLSSITAADCMRQALFAGWVSRFGVPATITSDRGGPVHVCPVGGPVQPAQHPAFTHDSIPSTIKRIGRAVPQMGERRLAVQGRHRRLARPPPLGDAGHQGLIQGRKGVFTSGGGIRFTTDPARPVCQHHRIRKKRKKERKKEHLFSQHS
jgi:hypothetical protein